MPEERDAAVEYLSQAGFRAHKRDWILGETVFVGVEPSDSGLCQGIVTLRHGLYICPSEQGWRIEGWGKAHDGENFYVTLRAACVRAVELLQQAIASDQKGA